VSVFLIVATGGAGGDLQPQMAAALALRGRGHEIRFIGDGPVARIVSGLGLEAEVLPPQLDLGPRLAGSIREAMAHTGGDLLKAGPLVEQSLAAWATEVASVIKPVVAGSRPDGMITSLFGVEVLKEAAPPCPWAVVNSTFYVGPHPPRPVELDIGPRAVPLLSRYATLVQSADLVLHATDQIFDFGFDNLPPRHHYVGPLGMWEPDGEAPSYLHERGDPWVLVSISSQLQDDLPLAEAALSALSEKPVRVLLTVGPDHRADEISVRPSNARIEQTAPHSAALKGGRMLVSHAGHGSVMKALWYGRPMVLMPWGRDQPGVAARAQALGVAEVVNRGVNDPRNALADAIDRTLASSQMQQAAAAHSARLQMTDPPRRAAELLETLL
jgi:UDP:flavonoid glycosyltransferase YjiC (YdhE family)